MAGRVRYYAGAGQDPEPPGHTCSYQETEMKEREREGISEPSFGLNRERNDDYLNP